MSVIDITFLVLTVLLMIRCYLKGLVSEVFSMSAVLLGVLAAVYFYKNGAVYLKENFLPGLNSPIPELIAFFALFVIVFLIVKFIDLLLKGIVTGVNLGGADKFLGLIFGFAEGIAAISLVLFFLQLIKPIYDASSLLSDSFIAKILLPLIAGLGNLPNV